MCGIAGYLRLRPNEAAPLSTRVAGDMLEAIRRRGPDGEGNGAPPTSSVGWAIGASPSSIFHTGTSRCATRTGRSGPSSTARSTTTPLCVPSSRRAVIASRPAAIPKSWCTATSSGSRGLAERLQGLFAFAVYDTVKHTLGLARDPMGVKPLYWWSDGKTLLFASEMKSLLRHPALRDRRVNRAGVAQVLVTRYVSRPSTMFEWCVAPAGGLLHRVRSSKAMRRSLHSAIGCALPRRALSISTRRPSSWTCCSSARSTCS